MTRTCANRKKTTTKNQAHICLSQHPFTCCFWLWYLEDRLNHGTIEHFSLEGTSGGHITELPAQSNYIRLLRNLPRLFLKISKEEDSTSFQNSRHGRYIGDTNATSRLELISNYMVFGTRQKSRESHNSLKNLRIFWSLIHIIWHWPLLDGKTASTSLKFHLASPCLTYNFAVWRISEALLPIKDIIFNCTI